MSGTSWSRQGDAWDFLEALCELPAQSWLSTFSRLPSTAPFNAARRELNALVRQHCPGLIAWDLHDGLETVAWHVSQVFERAGFGRQALARDTIEAARIAAMALLLRQQLGEARFWLLYEPFQATCPQLGSVPRGLRCVFTKSLCGVARGSTNLQRFPSTRRT